MAARIPIEQKVAQPPVQETLPSPHQATQQAVLDGQEAPAWERSTAAQGEGEATPIARITYGLREPTTILVGVALLAAVALFVAGGARRPVEAALGRLLTRIADNPLPMVLPVTFLEIVRELLADRNEVTAFAPDRRTAR
jgi:hypothetical protein